MSDKTKDVLNKITALLEKEYPEKEYLHKKYTDAPVRKCQVLFNLFPHGAPTEFDIDIVERLIVESKQQASNYNQSKLVIGEYLYSKSIILYYYETEQDVFERLSNEYNILLKEIKQKNDNEYLKYKELKSKYEPDIKNNL